MIKIFVSMPMAGKTPEQIREEMQTIYEKAVKRLQPDHEKEIFVLIDTFIEGSPPKNVKNDGLWYLGESIRKMASADYVVFAEDFLESRGTRTEFKAAREYGCECLFV